MRRLYPAATYAPLPEAELQPTIRPVLIIFHTIVGSAAGAENVMRGDWYGESHFVLPFGGGGRQLMPLDRRADCNWQVNAWSTNRPLTMADGSVVPAGTICGALSIETEDDGTPEDTEWTPAQIEWLARFTAWAHHEWGIPLDRPADPFSPGVGYHSLPGLNTLKIWDPNGVPPYGTMLDKSGRVVNIYNPWTNTVGKSCPGAARIAQFPGVLELAYSYAYPTSPRPEVQPPTTTEDDDMPRLIQPENDPTVLLLDGLTCTHVRDGNVLTELRAAGIVSPTAPIVSVKRLALSAFVLVGPVPPASSYVGAPANQNQRTIATDFAGHRPNG